MQPDPKIDPLRELTDRGNRPSPVIERVPVPFVEVRGKKHVVEYVNSAFCRLLGRSRNDLIGNPFAEIVPVGDDCLPILDRVYQTGEPFPHAYKVEDEPRPAHWLYAKWPALEAGEPPVGVIIQLTRPVEAQEMTAINEALLISGLHQHELTANAVKLNGQLETEIKDHKAVEAAQQTANRRLADQTNELEGLVAERTEKLRETVADLEAFSYSVAHDMRTPLRGMQGFARILLDDHADNLGVDARSYLERIASSAARMDLLIQDSLNYTRVLRGEALLQSVDLDKLARDMIATYPNWQAPKVIIQIEGSLPHVLGHEGFLTQCVSNILSNAIKFVAPGVTPHVRIWAEDRPVAVAPASRSAENEKGAGEGVSDAPTVRIWFEDNGIGIAASDRGRVFRMFERINPAEQFEGTGIGLTIVRKAVQRLGGRTDFDSEAGKGSQFWIELKKVPDQSATAGDLS
jgi:signal transduction histidine kinase